MSRKDNLIFRVPIYREQLEKYHEYLTKIRDRRIEQEKKNGFNYDSSYEQYLCDNPPPINPRKISWKYNRIIGWIEFYAEEMQIKADLWFFRGKRVPKQFSRVIIDYRSKIGDVTGISNPDNKVIRYKIREFLDRLQSGLYWKKLSNYYIDSSFLLRNLDYMDVRKLLTDLLEEENE
ncbi:MAG: hypothetical protein ISS81_00905 [Candidatus Marinimicrobia bacterium]|nr:hypothetical protein [Candidatus Neomarinimicrobiota bacterium]